MSAVVPPVYVMVRVPVSALPQSRAPSASTDSWVPMTVVDRTLADSARSVDRSARRRAGRNSEVAARSFSGFGEGSEEVQAVSTVSAAAIATERTPPRPVVHFIRPPVPLPCAHANPGHSPLTQERAPHREGAGPVADQASRQAQTAAGSSSTRRLRVRFGSTGMPGPIVVLIAAFLM